MIILIVEINIENQQLYNFDFHSWKKQIDTKDIWIRVRNLEDYLEFIILDE